MFRRTLFTKFILIIILLIIGGQGIISQPAGSARAAIAYDLVADSIEVTQAIQDLNNSVRQLAGKRTFVRVYAHSVNVTVPTFAQLVVETGGQTKTIYPIAPGGPTINVRSIYNRALPSHAFLFELPSAFTTGTVNLYATINPITSWRPNNDPIEVNYSNNVVSTQVTFETVPPLQIAIGSQPYTFNNLTYSPSFNDRWMMFKWITRAYPVNKVALKLFTLPEVKASRKSAKNGFDLTKPNCTWLNAILFLKKVIPIWGGIFNPGNSPDDFIHWYGMVQDGAGFMRGCASDAFQVGSGPTGSGNQGWDFDGSYGDWYGGHELAHTFQRNHTLGGPNTLLDGCGDESEGGTTVKQYPNGRISPTTDNYSPLAIFGFDSGLLDQKKNPILGPIWRDVMTYCDYQWISDKTYEGLMSTFQNTLPDPSQPDAAAINLSDRLGITGYLYPASQTGVLNPSLQYFQVPDSEPRLPGPYVIVLRDPVGLELARYPFTPDVVDDYPSPGADPAEPMLQISELVPYVAQTAWVDIEGPDGQAWVSRLAGLNLPAVQILSPLPGENIDIVDMDVSWNATDSDGDPVTVNVEYSPDNGATWNVVGLFLEGNQAVIPADNLPTSNQALVRLVASDGIHSTTTVMAGAFFVPNHQPTVEISNPQNGVVIASDQTLTLEGFAYDYDLGYLDDAYLTWSSDINGVLGSGATLALSGLSAAYHTITLNVDDGQGGTASASVDVSVVLTPNDLPVLPDGLIVEPKTILLEPLENLSSALISIENQNPNVIAWSVSYVDQPWVLLSAVDGSTPQDITLNLDMSQLGMGTYIANITFSSRSSPKDQVVQVIVHLPEYQTMLPLVIK
jgi:hypothetical protein